MCWPESGLAPSRRVCTIHSCAYVCLFVFSTAFTLKGLSLLGLRWITFSLKSRLVNTASWTLPHAVAAWPSSLARALAGALPQPPRKLFSFSFFFLKKTQIRMRVCALLRAWIQVVFFISFSNYCFLSQLTEQMGPGRSARFVAFWVFSCFLFSPCIVNFF